VSLGRCDFVRAFGHRCGGEIRAVPGPFGKLEYACVACERRRAGVCERCPRPVHGTIGRALRCQACERLEKKGRSNRYRARHLEERRAADRRWHKIRAKARRGGRPPMSAREKGLLAIAARNASLTPERRREIAHKAITTRWARVRAAA
jgi:hypothetical protein